jgi:hypothetical protein
LANTHHSREAGWSAGSVGDNARGRVAARHTAVFRLREAGNAVSGSGRRPKRYWMRYSS